MTATAIACLIDAHTGGLALFARGYCSTPEDAVMASFAKLAALRRDPDDPAAWLFRAVKHAAIDAGKAEARRKKRERACARPEAWFAEDTADARHAVEALQSLDAELRDVVVMRLWGGLTLQQVADALGIGVGTAHRRYEAAILELRARLGETPRD